MNKKTKTRILNRMHKMLDDLEAALQGDYEKRNAILSDFESIIDMVKDYE